MRAISQKVYGGPEVLELRDIDRPVVTDDDVLVRVHAAAVNPADWHFMTGTPYNMAGNRAWSECRRVLKPQDPRHRRRTEGRSSDRASGSPRQGARAASARARLSRRDWVHRQGDQNTHHPREAEDDGREPTPFPRPSHHH